MTLEEEQEKTKQEFEHFQQICENVAKLTTKQKNNMYYKMGYIDGMYNKANNFFTYLKSRTKFCKKIFEQQINSVNEFRDNIVEKIADDFVAWHKSEKCDIELKDEMDCKFTVVGILGELFNIFYLENISSYRTKSGYLKQFKNVVPFNIYFEQKDWGADLLCVDEHNEICVFQVKFYSTWSIMQGHKLELKKHCFGTMCETMRMIYDRYSYLKDHVFVTILGDKTKDVSISLQNSPYKSVLTIIDNNKYDNDTVGNTTLFKDFYKFLCEI